MPHVHAYANPSGLAFFAGLAAIAIMPLLAAPIALALFGSSVAGPQMHAHVCPGCGTRWTHDDRAFGDVAAHTCPTCGTLEWRKA